MRGSLVRIYKQRKEKHAVSIFYVALYHCWWNWIEINMTTLGDQGDDHFDNNKKWKRNRNTRRFNLRSKQIASLKYGWASTSPHATPSPWISKHRGIVYDKCHPRFSPPPPPRLVVRIVNSMSFSSAHLNFPFIIWRPWFEWVKNRIRYYFSHTPAFLGTTTPFAAPHSNDLSTQATRLPCKWGPIIRVEWMQNEYIGAGGQDMLCAALCCPMWKTPVSMQRNIFEAMKERPHWTVCQMIMGSNIYIISANIKFAAKPPIPDRTDGLACLACLYIRYTCSNIQSQR